MDTSSFKFQAAAVAIVAVVTFGLTYAASTTDLSSNAASLLAAATKSSPLAVVSPNGGETLLKGETATITWSGGTSRWSVSLHLLNEERTKTIRTIATNTKNSGSYSWRVPADVPTGSYYLRLACGNCKSNVRDGTDYSNASFTIASSTVPMNVSLNGTPTIQVETQEGLSDTVRATIPFRITARSQDVWIAKKSAMGEVPIQGYVGQYYADGSTSIVTSLDGVVSAGSIADDSDTGFKVPANTSRVFTLAIVGTAYTTGVIGYKITGIGYDTDPIVDSQSPVYSDALADFHTPLAAATAISSGPVSISVISKSALSDGSDGPDTGTFRIRYKLTAGDSPIYVSRLTTLGVGPRYFVSRDGSVSSIDATKTSASLVNLSNTSTTANGNYRIGAGQSQTFDLTVVVPVSQIGVAGMYRLNLIDIYWDTDDDATPDNDYATPLIRTDYLYLDNG